MGEEPRYTFTYHDEHAMLPWEVRDEEANEVLARCETKDFAKVVHCALADQEDLMPALAEVARLRAALQDIATYGRANPGYGYSCATKAIEALAATPQS